MSRRSDRRGDPRQRSDANGGLTFLVDESLGARIVPDALRAAGFDVKTVVAHFGAGTLDTAWLPEAGRAGWLVLTADQAIQRNPLELRAMAEANVRLFVVSARGLSGPDIAAMCVALAPRMIALSGSNPPPFVARVTRGRVALTRSARVVRRRAPRT